MARISPYAQRVGAPGPVSSQEARAVDSGLVGFGQALQKSADSIAATDYAVAERKRKEEEQDEVIEAQKFHAAYLSDLAQRVPPEKVTTEYAEQMAEEVKTTYDTAVGNFSSKQARAYLEVHGAQTTGNVFQESLRYQRVQLASQAKANILELHAADEQAIYAKPEMYGAILASRTDDIESGVGNYQYLAEDQRQKLLMEHRESLAWTAAMQAVDTQQGRKAMVSKTPPDFFKDLNPQNKERVLARIEKIRAHDAAVAERAVAAQIKNQQAYFALTGQASPQAIPQGAFGDNVALRDAYNISRKTQLALSNSGSVADANKVLESMKPVDPKDPNYAAKAVAYLEGQKMLSERAKLIKDDYLAVEAAGMFSKQITQVDLSKPDMLGQIALRAPYAREAAQRHGVPLEIVTKHEAAQMAQHLASMRVTEQAAFLQEVFTKLPGREAQVLLGQISKVGTTIKKTKDGEIPVGTATFEAAGTILRARTKDSQSVAFTMLNGKEIRNPSIPSDEEVLKVMSATVGKASPEFVRDAPQYVEAVRNHYIGTLAAQGVADFGVKDNARTLKASINTVVGKPVKIGAGAVLPPWGVKEDEFIDLVEDRVARKPGTYSLIPREDRGDGVYQIKVNDIAQNEFVDIYSPKSKPATESVIGKIDRFIAERMR